MKRTIIFAVIVLIVLGTWYGWKEYNRTNEDLSELKATVIINASDLVHQFEKDSVTAGKQYIDKLIVVTGRIKNIDKDGNPVVISLGEEGQMSSVQCSMDSTHASDYKSLAGGNTVRVKGICTGAISQDLFGTDVKLSRCILEKNKY